MLSTDPQQTRIEELTADNERLRRGIAEVIRAMPNDPEPAYMMATPKHALRCLLEKPCRENSAVS